MALLQFSLIFVLLTFCALSVNGQAASKPCPFDGGLCKCVDLASPVNISFFAVTCTFPTSVQFTPSTTRYTTEQLTLNVGDGEIKPQGLSIFSSIKTINYGYLAPSQPPIAQKWDPLAFDGVTGITTLNTYMIAGVIPPPPALVKLTGLKTLRVQNGGQVQLKDGGFSAFTSLFALEISDSQITEMSPSAFSNLDNTLKVLTLASTSLQEYPTAAIANLKNVQTLNLMGNQIKSIPKDALSPLGMLISVFLQNNPISSIDVNAFWSLKAAMFIDLRFTKLTSIDLSIFPFVEPTGIWRLDENAELKTLTVSNVDTTADKANIYLINTGLETVDKKIEGLLKQKPSFKIDISYNIHLKCDGIEWIAPYANSTQVKIEGARCTDKNNQLLDEYLKIDPSSTSTVSTTTPAKKSSAQVVVSRILILALICGLMILF